MSRRDKKRRDMEKFFFRKLDKDKDHDSVQLFKMRRDREKQKYLE